VTTERRDAFLQVGRHQNQAPTSTTAPSIVILGIGDHNLVEHRFPTMDDDSLAQRCGLEIPSEGRGWTADGGEETRFRADDSREDENDVEDDTMA
jgi:hypothetical protein